MLFLHKLTDFLRERPHAKTPQPRPTTRLRLEQLEDRVVPSFTTATYTNATVQIIPGLTVTETVTAMVTPYPGFDFQTHQITPIPAGATAPTGGTVLFDLNDQQQSATVDSNGQANVTFHVPLLAFLASQTLEVKYQAFFDKSSGNAWGGSGFTAPLYKNFDNLFLPATLTFNQLTPQQVYSQLISYFQHTPYTLVPYMTAQGETDTLGGDLIAFDYVDPGAINTVTALGMQLPGIFASQLGAYQGMG
jgi:hypothetical protein